MLVIVFRSRIREDCDLARLEAVGQRMSEIASSMPGFMSYKDFAAADGENLTVVEFTDEATLLAWRNHPEHVSAQQLAREEFFSDYQIQVCQPQRAYHFDQGQGRIDLTV